MRKYVESLLYRDRVIQNKEFYQKISCFTLLIETTILIRQLS